MSGTPRVSLVMPAWEPDVAWMRAAVDAVLQEQECGLELIVVDDGNDVPVESILAEIDDPRVRIVRIEHAGASVARNVGTHAATGEFIRYVDADDLVVPGGTGRMLDHADAHTIVYGVTQVCDEAMTPVYRIESRLQGDAVAECLLGRFDVRHVSMLFPAGIARDAGLWDPDLHVCEDWDFVLRCVEHARVLPVPDVVTRYRRHERSATRASTAGDAWRYGQRRVVEKYLERHPEQHGSPLARAARKMSYRVGATRALDDRAFRAFLTDALALTRLAPLASVPLWRHAASVGVRSLAARAMPRSRIAV